MGEARADGLDESRIFAVLRQQRDSAWNQNRWQIMTRRQSHHHGGQTLVAGGDSNDSATGRQ